jgi:hypothetical protein
MIEEEQKSSFISQLERLLLQPASLTAGFTAVS